MAAESTGGEDVHVVVLCTDDDLDDVGDGSASFVDTSGRPLPIEAATFLLERQTASAQAEATVSTTTTTTPTTSDHPATRSSQTPPPPSHFADTPEPSRCRTLLAAALTAPATGARIQSDQETVIVQGHQSGSIRSCLVRPAEEPRVVGSVHPEAAAIQMVVMPYRGIDTVDQMGSNYMVEGGPSDKVVIEGSDTAATSQGGEPSVEGQSSSVLRTLLQASSKQMEQYQTHKQQSASSVPTNGSGVSSRTWRRSPDPAEGSRTPGDSSPRSEIRALLLGQTYQRAAPPPTCVVSPSDVLDLARRRVSGEDEDDDDHHHHLHHHHDPPVKRARAVHSDSGDHLHHHQVVLQEHSLPPLLVEVVELVEEFGDLGYSVQRGPHRHAAIEVRRKGLYGFPTLGLTPAQVVVTEEGRAHFLIAVVTTTATSVDCRDPHDRLSQSALRPLLHRLSIRGGHVFCPGLAAELANCAPHTKNLIRVALGQHIRHQARDCLVWFQLGPSQSWLPLNEGIYKCKPCKSLERYVKLVRRAQDRAAGRKDEEEVVADMLH